MKSLSLCFLVFPCGFPSFNVKNHHWGSLTWWSGNMPFLGTKWPPTNGLMIGFYTGSCQWDDEDPLESQSQYFLSRESPKLSLRCPGWLAYPNHPQPPRSEKSINSRVILASYKSLQFTFTVIKTSATWSAICHLLRCRCSDLEWWLPWLKNYTWSTLYSKTEKENHWNWEDCWCFESESQGDWIVTGIHWHCDRIPALLRLLSALSRLVQVK